MLKHFLLCFPASTFRCFHTRCRVGMAIPPTAGGSKVLPATTRPNRLEQPDPLAHPRQLALHGRLASWFSRSIGWLVQPVKGKFYGEPHLILHKCEQIESTLCLGRFFSSWHILKYMYCMWCRLVQPVDSKIRAVVYTPLCLHEDANSV